MKPKHARGAKFDLHLYLELKSPCLSPTPSHLPITKGPGYKQNWITETLSEAKGLLSKKIKC